MKPCSHVSVNVLDILNMAHCRCSISLQYLLMEDPAVSHAGIISTGFYRISKNLHFQMYKDFRNRDNLIHYITCTCMSFANIGKLCNTK